jgi:hypothetical protein
MSMFPKRSVGETFWRSVSLLNLKFGALADKTDCQKYSHKNTTDKCNCVFNDSLLQRHFKPQAEHTLGTLVSGTDSVQ